MVEAPVTDRISIQLGDIIKIEAPLAAATWHNKKYFVKYVGPRQIHLISEDGVSETTLFVNEDGTLRDEAITGVNILSQAPVSGYARQNDLIPQTWIDI